MGQTETGFNVPLKCTPEEYKHFVEPAMGEAEKSNFPSALDIVANGLNAHPASEGLLFLKAYFGYKVADSMSNQLAGMPKAIERLQDGSLLIDGAATSRMLVQFTEIIKVLEDSDGAIDELLQVNPASQEVTGFKNYIKAKLERLEQESSNVRNSLNNSTHIAGGFCQGCRQSISFDSQKVVFRRASATQMEVFHEPCYHPPN
ncbi:MAG TPA: hypothetical protein VE177_05350 [Candidatus Binatus sp.]|nr:hypothetical protein [Candidatus Binatus sp.]